MRNSNLSLIAAIVMLSLAAIGVAADVDLRPADGAVPTGLTGLTVVTVVNDTIGTAGTTPNTTTRPATSGPGSAADPAGPRAAPADDPPTPGDVPPTLPPLELDDLNEAEVRGFAALETIDFPWRDRLPEWEIRFHEASEGAYGYTLTREQRIDIYVRPTQSDALLAHVIAHELGHALDVTLNDGDDRRRWQASRGIATHPWWPDNRASDFATGAGDFAESFAAWQVGIASFRSELGPTPSPDQELLLAELTGG